MTLSPPSPHPLRTLSAPSPHPLRTLSTRSPVRCSSPRARHPPNHPISAGWGCKQRASRFDPKNPDGHYALEMTSPWDRFIAETLLERMLNEKGESWINVTHQRKVLEMPPGGWT